MPEFLVLTPPMDALNKLLPLVNNLEALESVDTSGALGRVLGENIYTSHPMPSFRRSTVDGYAVIAKDTHGASSSIPAYLILAGEVPMGGEPKFRVVAGECALIHTGGMLPEGCDAVVMIEVTNPVNKDEIEIMQTVSDGENVIQIGEDVQKGDKVLSLGTILKPAEIGGLMALGITKIQAKKLPIVGIISSGDEVVPPDQGVKPGQVRDINSFSLAGLIENAGGKPIRYGIVADTEEALFEKAKQALSECDMLVFTAGSSASVRDLTSTIIDKLGDPGVLVHGVNVKPGKPTILGFGKNKPIIGLPGNPVSALVIARIFLIPVIRKLLGQAPIGISATISAKLSINLASQASREEWVAVSITGEDGDYLAEPIFGKSNLIFTIAGCDGYVRVPPAANGISAGETVKVYLR
jgi:molybdopterin molybdotransferase